MLEIVARTIREESRRKFVYAYWPDLDSLGHAEGIESAQAGSHLLDLDHGLADLADALSGTDTLLVVAADHGQIDTADVDRIDLDDHPDLAETLILPLCGESRMAYCYVRPDRVRQFERYVIENLEEVAELAPSRDLVEAGWFGPGVPHPRLSERIGDYALMMRGRHIIRDWLPQESRHVLIGVHGGVSEDEMLVPLVLHRA
jgi:predicted AlkP superfamily pyrophosphatase or phosphodiesterase